MSTINIFQVSLGIWGCLLCVVLAIIAGNRAYKFGGAFKKVWTMLLLNGIFLASDSFAYVFRGDTTDFGCLVTRISCFLTFLFEGILCWYYLRVVEFMVGDDSKKVGKSRLGALCRICIAIVILGLLATPFFDFYYSFDETNHYRREAGIVIPFLLLGLVCVLNGARLFLSRGSLSYNMRKVFRIALVIFICCIAMQVIVYGFSFISFGVTLTLVILFINLWHEDYNRDMALQVESMENVIRELQEKVKAKV